MEQFIKETAEYQRIYNTMLNINSILKPNSAIKIKGLSQDDVIALEMAYSVLERLYNAVGDDLAVK